MIGAFQKKGTPDRVRVELVALWPGISQPHFPANMTSLRTCAECNNILYPREDPDNKRLLYACRHCDYSEIASQAVVYRNDLQKSASETAGVTTDVASDPTLVRLRH